MEPMGEHTYDLKALMVQKTDNKQHVRKHYTVRMIPINPYDLNSLEIYLSEMRKKGLAIKHLGLVSIFERCEPKNMEYRIEPMLKKVTKEEECVHSEPGVSYLRCGFTYIGTYLKYFLIFAKGMEPADYPNEKAFACDQDLMKGYTYKKCKFAQFDVFFLGLILFCFSILKLPQRNFFLYDITTYSIIRHNGLPFLLLGLLYLLFGLIYYSKTRMYLHDIRHYCEQKRISHRNFKKKDWLYLTDKFLLVILAFVALITVHCHFLPSHQKVEAVLPYLRLQQVEAGITDLSDLRLEDGITDLSNLRVEDGKTYDSNQKLDPSKVQKHSFYMELDSSYQTDSSFFVPVQIKSNETGRPGNVSFTEYRSHCYAEYYELRFEYMVKSFFHQMMQEKISEQIRDNNFYYQNDLSKDFLTCIRIDGIEDGEMYRISSSKVQYLFGYRGKKVVMIRYSGAADLEKSVDTYLKLLQ